MLKEFAQYLVGLGNKTILTSVDGQQLATGDLQVIAQPRAAALTVNSLTGLVDYLTTNYDKYGPVLVQVLSPTEVNVYGTHNRDKKRDHLLQAAALLPTINYRFQDTESFNILLQSCFVPNQDSATLLQIVGNVTDEDIRSFGDDGVSQKVTVKKGVATVGDVKVPNPVNLKPFRTFSEVTQPESAFVFRMKTGHNGPEAALFEADGGAWKLAAVHAIRDYLGSALATQITQGQVTIIA